ncbi:MAG: 1-acyl-sn-glycerol-3-phosphate acyltransferase [Anaerolineae bacterium]|nr:1-acyl-sn-glycerol-3-phosphate acyltransferase [Anaerolineae bacterium]
MRNFVRGLIRLIFNSIARFEIRGKENVPELGAFVIAVNHIGIIDIAMFHYVFDRYDMFIPVGEKWEKTGWIRWLAQNLNFLFVDRFNPDLKALRKMIALMDSGNSLVIAPEGTRSKTGALIEGKPGVAYLAARSGFPVVPVAITGTEDKVIFGNIKRLRKSPVTLTAGKPFTLPPIPRENREETLQAFTDEIMCQIAALLPERYHGVYAEHPRLKELKKINTKEDQ